MSKKDSLPRKKAVIAALQATNDIDGLSAVFLTAFGDVRNAQLHQAKSLKSKLISTQDALEKFQIWRDIVSLQVELSQYEDNRLEALIEQGIDLNSLRQAYILPDNIDELQKESWQIHGERFLSGTISEEKIQSLKDVTHSISQLLRSNPTVNEKIVQLENEFISPLANKARDIIGEIRENGKSEALMSEFEDIQTAIESVHRTQIDPVITAYSLELDDKSKLQLQNLQEDKRQIGSALMSEVYDTLITESVVTEEESQTWARNQEISPSAIARMRKSGYSEAEVRRDMALYYRLVNGRLDKVRIVTTGSRRASAIINTATVDIDDNFDKRTLFHEMSHLLESDQSVKLANQKFISNRASGTPKRLSELTNNSSYKNDEIAIPDNFYSPYVGKIYESGATEVASMGIQQFSSPESMYALYESDEEMFTLMVGMMTGVSHSQVERQKALLEKQVHSANFSSSVRKVIRHLSWQDGHRLKSDKAWQEALSGKGKTNAHNKKWAWTRTLGTCVLYPAKAPKQRKQIYGVTVIDTEKEDKRHFFREKEQAETFIYLHELSIRGIKPLPQSAYYLACNKQAPDWYQSDTELPLI
ncbi:conserved hypothetical protein [Vibrio nigripulchritudo SOn1]|uniref:Uncharacterized protein n=1 Tax=Vibrio nigripulchritudo SOn1 TaxID=1238450 RepID=A0AAV2VQD1_9VIBR|nr:hypothetical protein [Vibrio nigripulchritudo]CCO46648.1 conserved hypothetical protein [Vibrio nigripulchritudo SOn1]